MKTIVVEPAAGRVASLLAEKGYRVVSSAGPGRDQPHVDAVLYLDHEYQATVHSSAQAIDHQLTTGGFPEDLPPIRLNITGMDPRQAVEALEARLYHHNWRQ